jgi:hypothetical protein
LSRCFEKIDQLGFPDIPDEMFLIDEAIAGKEIPIVFDHRDIPAGLREDTEPMPSAQGCLSRLLEHLDSDLADVLTHPLIQDGAEKSAKGLRGHGQRAYTSINIRSGFHQRQKTYGGGFDLLEETVNIEGKVHIPAVDDTQHITRDSVLTQEFISAERSSPRGRGFSFLGSSSDGN